ncbi:FtsX-like permease family protein [Thermosipho ferrireducens]|uniref:FtsX-like permease family protein n=1 Tax=Thermosipho ferrireducens TaxID=2571116 RepID=A0ABX7S8K6_9BACT|nr:FtsX-like permease family protein [Thermosipho ferrireducens]
MFKIAARNFLRNWKISVLVILGTMIATMLIVGALSLNDSVNSWFEKKIENNFGKIDLILKDKSDSFFFPKPLDVKFVSEYLEKMKKEKIVKDYTYAALVSARVKVNKQFFDIFAIGYDDDFIRFTQKNYNGVVISRDFVKTLSLTQNSTVTLITMSGKHIIKIDYVGLQEFNFRGETAMTNGSVFMPWSLIKKYRLYTFNAPNIFFISLSLPVEKHRDIAEKISKDLGVRVVATKYELRYSPLNKVIGYLFLGFSGFALLSSFLFISNFFGVLAEDRRRTFGILRAIGFSKFQIASVLFVEGTMYLIASAGVGAFAGIYFGKYLLTLVNRIPAVLASETALTEKISHVITLKTIFVGGIFSIILPVLILLMRSKSFSKLSPVVLLSDAEILPRKFLKYLFLLLPLITLSVDPYYALIVSIMIIPIFLKNNLLQLLSGSLVLVLSYFILGTGGRWGYLSRAGFFLIGSVYIVFGLVPYLKKYLKRYIKVSTILALSYIEKQKWRNFVVFLVYSVITLVILLTAVLPTSIFTYINNKLQTGILGYNFLIVENPLKIFFSGDYYTKNSEFTSLFEDIVNIQLVNGKVGSKEGVFILSNEEILKSLKLGNKNIEAKLYDVVGSSRVFSKKGMVDVILKGVLPGISGKVKETFNVIDTYDPRELVVPFDGIILYDKKISGSLRGYAGIVRNFEAAKKAKNIVYERFDGPIFVTEELDKIFSSIRHFVNIAIQLFYFGFVSGFSGLTIVSIKNVYSRKRIVGSLKAIGVMKKEIFGFFLLEALIIVTMAILTALIAATFITIDLTSVITSELPDFSIVIPWGQLSLIIIGVYAITIIFTLYPANLAQKINPSDAIRVYD